MAYTVRPDDDVVSLPPTEWKDWTGAEEALSKLAHVSGGGAQSKSFGNSETGGPLADATLFVAATPPRRRAGRVLLRYMIAVCFGVAATLSWQRYGEPVQQSVARWVPQLVWPDAAAELASVPAAQQAGPVEQAVAEPLTPPAPPAPAVASVAAPPNDATASDLADLRRTVERIAASQEQMARDISNLANLRPARQETRPKVSAAPVAPVASQSVAVLPPPLPPPPQRPAPPVLD
jgi:hypothetical protein